MYDINSLFCGEPGTTFIISELSANHNQDFDLAVQSIRAMKKAGANAVKLQTFHPESMTLDSDLPWFQTRLGTLWEGRRLFDLYKEAETPWAWHKKLQEVATEEGLIFFSSPFDASAVDFLESLDLSLYKIASPEITDIPLIEKVAWTGKPVILSSGIATEADINLAVNTIRNTGNENIAILKCTTAYPAPFEEINLQTIPDIRERFGVIPGLSDHTLGVSIPIAAVALGAKIIEKHFILDRALGGLDSAFSLEPSEFAAMVTAIRQVELSLGSVNYELTMTTKSSRKAARSLFAVDNINQGEVFSSNNVRSLRPGLGLHPQYLSSIIGKKATVAIVKGSPLEWGMVDK
jgi:pseudaminic acid synthase